MGTSGGVTVPGEGDPMDSAISVTYTAISFLHGFLHHDVPSGLLYLLLALLYFAAGHHNRRRPPPNPNPSPGTLMLDAPTV